MCQDRRCRLRRRRTLQPPRRLLVALVCAVEQIKALPGCESADAATYSAQAALPACSSWLKAPKSLACPAECAQGLNAASEPIMAPSVLYGMCRCRLEFAIRPAIVLRHAPYPPMLDALHWARPNHCCRSSGWTAWRPSPPMNGSKRSPTCRQTSPSITRELLQCGCVPFLRACLPAAVAVLCCVLGSAARRVRADLAELDRTRPCNAVPGCTPANSLPSFLRHCTLQPQRMCSASLCIAAAKRCWAPAQTAPPAQWTLRKCWTC